MTTSTPRIFLLSLMISMLITGSGCNRQADQSGQQQGPPPVTVAQPLVRPVTEWDEYTGRFQAVERVEIRARVTGYLDSIEFDDGQIVQQGDLLFVIDQRPFSIARDRAQAQYTLAQKEFERAEELIGRNVIPQEEYDRRQQEQAVARATLNQARLDMEFTEVRAPVTGRISTERVDVGNLVIGNETLLTVIVSLDPIHFIFDASERELLRYTRLDRSGQRPGSQDNPNPIFVKLFDEEDYVHEGQMDFVDNEVDLGTGTIRGRAILPNPDRVIYPGQTGRARLVGSGEYDAILVPDEAIGTDQSRKFVLVVGEDNTVQMRFVTLGPLRDNGLRIIRDGLSEDDRIIINGLQRARPGSPVTPEPGEISDGADSSGS